MFEATFFLPVRKMYWIWTPVTSADLCVRYGSGARDGKVCERISSRRRVMEVGTHAFESSLSAGDLHEMNYEEHRHPEQLQGGPDDEDDSERVLVKNGA